MAALEEIEIAIEREPGWQFFVDRGGTFTDIVARSPGGNLTIHKLLSDNPGKYKDATIAGIRHLLDVKPEEAIDTSKIDAVKMGTTVATNALLERTGEPTVLVITKGFADALRIGYQNRPDIFALQISLPKLLYAKVIEVEERVSASGKIVKPLQLDAVRLKLREAHASGITSCAIVLMHGWRYSEHELLLEKAASDIGFTQISVSHKTSQLVKLISRGDTTVCDAYLSPILKRYVDEMESSLPATPLMFMQSNGGLAAAKDFHGKDSVLSGPAGGIVGAVKTASANGLEKIITFDMGGTSTDVSLYNGEHERKLESEIGGVRLRTPVLAIHTVAAGGGSILRFDGNRYKVGPQSAGANPGPACYRRGGPLTVTDCNVMVGKLQAQFFPHIFGEAGNLPLDAGVVNDKFKTLSEEITKATGDKRSAVEVAEGYLTVAVENMASAIKEISVQRGHNVQEYTLCSFGGAGGQHACKIADALGMKKIFVHPLAGVLSAYGMGLADRTIIKEQSVESTLNLALMSELQKIARMLAQEAENELLGENEADVKVHVVTKLLLRYQGTDSAMFVSFDHLEQMTLAFESMHYQRYRFSYNEKPLVVEALSVEVSLPSDLLQPVTKIASAKSLPKPLASVEMYSAGAWHKTPVYRREQLPAGPVIVGPAILVEATGTNVVELNWQAVISQTGCLVLERQTSSKPDKSLSFAKDKTAPDPVLLEVFNNLFMSVAEQMGITLQNTSHSVNIKERLDFSCAVFDKTGNLIANAPHIPVHLGSMGESVKSVIAAFAGSMNAGDAFAVNNPYNGGTHLPDITVVTPVFDTAGKEINFYVASRGHHADIGGITPGSMPPNSKTIEEEGILIDNFQLVANGEFKDREFSKLLTTGQYPARNIYQNIEDIKAQIAANNRGVDELNELVAHYGLQTVQAYMQHVQDNAEASVRKAISRLESGSFTCELDNGCKIVVAVTIDKDKQSAKIDFTGTSEQQENNFNAPQAVCQAAVLYVFRTLIDDDIPLNAGCLKPLEIIIPEGCMLNPRYPAAVVAGNVETSQAVTDALYGALGKLAASQGTMNNFTFGNDKLQYYETICGGAGAGPTFDGCDAVHTHMTNSRLTDPEVLEMRFPVLLEHFGIRLESGGKGQYRGGNGVTRRLRFLQPMTASILANRRRVPPFGLSSGSPAAVGRNWIERSDGHTEQLPATSSTEMRAGDVFIIETPGGGGYGNGQS